MAYFIDVPTGSGEIEAEGKQAGGGLRRFVATCKTDITAVGMCSGSNLPQLFVRKCADISHTVHIRCSHIPALLHHFPNGGKGLVLHYHSLVPEVSATAVEDVVVAHNAADYFQGGFIHILNQRGNPTTATFEEKFFEGCDRGAVLRI